MSHNIILGKRELPKKQSIAVFLLTTIVMLTSLPTHYITYPYLNLEIIGSPVTTIRGGLSNSTYTIDNIPFNASNATIIGVPEYVQCNGSPVYAINVIALTNDSSYQAIAELFTVKYDPQTNSYEFQKLKRFNSMIITDLAQGKNDTFYISSIDAEYPLYIHEEELQVSMISGEQVGFLYNQIIGARSIILKLDCGMNIISQKGYYGYSIESIDYNPVHNLLAIEGYPVLVSPGSNVELILNDWNILVLNATSLRTIYESNKYPLDTMIVPPTGIKWSPTGTYLAAGHLRENHPVIYLYSVENNTLGEALVENTIIESPLLTLSWIGYNDTLLLGNRSSLYIYNIENSEFKITTHYNTSIATSMIICCGNQPIKDLPLTTFILNYAEYFLFPNYSWRLIPQSSIRGLYIYNYNGTPTIIPVHYSVTTWNTPSLRLNMLPITGNQYRYPSNGDYIITYPRPYKLEYISGNNTIILDTYFDIISITNMSRIVIHTEPGAMINISSSESHYIDKITAVTKTIIYYNKPSTYTILFQLPKPNNYIGPNGILAQARNVVLSRNESVELFLDYNHLLGRFVISTPSNTNITVELYEMHRSHGIIINQSTLYYLAPGRYMVKISSNNPTYLVNSTYTIDIEQGEIYKMNLTLAQLYIATNNYHKVIVRGPGGSTVIEGVEGITTLWVIPGNYTIKLVNLESGEKRTSTLYLKGGDIVMYDALGYTQTESENQTQDSPNNNILGSVFLIGVVVVILFAIRYLKAK